MMSDVYKRQGSYSVGIKISTTSDEASHHIEIESNTIRNLYANATATVYPPNVYARKSRLKSRIKSAETANKELFLALFG